MTRALAIVLLAGCAHAPARSTPGAPRVANLHAFARLYGVVRWFHPSDAAAAVDWDRFAIDGAHRVVDAGDPRALRRALDAMFAPIAPTVAIVASGEPFPDVPALHPARTDGLEVVAWQHVGFGDSMLPGDYLSKRLHRDRLVPAPSDRPATVTQTIDAAPYRGQHLRLRGRIRTLHQGRGRLVLRVERPGGAGFGDDMARRPVIAAPWTTAEITGIVDADATKLELGVTTSGVGQTWFDDLELAVQDRAGAWRPIAIADAGFEAPDVWTGWQHGGLDGWQIAVDHDRPASGHGALRIEPAAQVLHDELFAEAPRAGETVDVELGSGLIARVPIALYSKGGHTLGDTEAPSAAPAPSGFDPIASAADVIVQWNVFEHFWPYWTAPPTAWLAELDVALGHALAERSIDDHVVTLQQLSVAAPDGHANVVCPAASPIYFAPFDADWIEGRVVITAAATAELHAGDVILTVDGQPAAQALAAQEAVNSGSPWRRRSVAASRIGRANHAAPIALALGRGDRTVHVTVPRDDHEPRFPPPRPPIERLADGTYYIDLHRVDGPDLTAIMERLAAAPGLVFDLRRGPNDNEWLSHLLTQPDTVDHWMAIPRIIRPDHPEAPAGWLTSGWNLPVASPHLRGRIAFLSGPQVRSFPESVLGFVEHYHLGAIVGGPSAGANGDVVVLGEPTGCALHLTGRRVTKLDGTRHHQVGFAPTIPVERTIAGIAAGRDEVLDRALAYVRTGL